MTATPTAPVTPTVPVVSTMRTVTVPDPGNTDYVDSRATMLDLLADFNSALRDVRTIDCHDATRLRALGLRPPRERIELLVDRDSPFLELCPLAGWAPTATRPTAVPHPTTPAGVMGGLGTVRGVRCVVLADTPGVREEDLFGPAKAERLTEVATVHRLPLIRLACVCDRGMPACHVDVFLPGREYSLSRPDYRVSVSAPDGGPRSEPDAFACDDRDAIGLARAFVARAITPDRTASAPGRMAAARYGHDPEDLLAIRADDPGRYDPSEVLSRVLDDAEFDEFQPYRGGCLAGWGELAAYPIRIIADRPGEPADVTATKIADFARLTNDINLPLLVLRSGAAEHPLRSVASTRQVTILLGGADPGHIRRPGFTFSWPAPGDVLERSARMLDDGVIDPRDTRIVLCVTFTALCGPAGALR